MKSQRLIFSLWAFTACLVITWNAKAQYAGFAPDKQGMESTLMQQFLATCDQPVQLPGFSFRSGFGETARGTKVAQYHADTINTYSLAKGNGRKIYTYDASQLPVTELIQRWLNSAWVDSVLTTTTYDANGNPLTIIVQSWVTSAWENKNKTTYTYNGSGNVLTTLSEEWQNNAWENTAQLNYTYNAQEQLITMIGYVWQVSTWKNYAQITYTYDANGYAATVTFQYWQNNAWTNSQLLTSSYDANGNLVTMKLQIWQNNAWVNSAKITATYDNNNNPTTEILQTWNIIIFIWENDAKNTLSYDINNNCISELYQDWVVNTWENDEYLSRVFDSDNNLLKKEVQDYVNNAWVNLSKLEFDYQPGMITGSAFEWVGPMWNPVDANIEVNYMGDLMGTGESSYSVEVIYSSYQGVKDQGATPATVMTVYPNPAAGRVSIAINPLLTGDVALSLYDLAGRLLEVLFDGKTGNAAGLTFDTGSVPAGVYILELRNAGRVDRQKLSVIQ